MRNTKKNGKRFWIELIVLTLLYILMDTAGIYKYIAVMGASAVIVAFNFKNKKTILQDGYIMIPAIVHCGIGVLLSIFCGAVTFWTLKTVVFWMLPPLFSLAMCLVYSKEKHYMIDIQFFACILAYLGMKIGYILILGEFESTFAFVYGLFILYYAYHKKWSWMVIAGVLMYLANKRIATLAVVLCLALMVFMKIVKYSKKWIVLLWGMLVGACSAYVYSIQTGLFLVFCEKFGIDTSHRIEVYPKIAEQIPDKYFWGQGLGRTNIMLGEVLDPFMHSWFENPHNDFLKIFVDLGIIGFAFFLASFLIVYYIAWGKGVEKCAVSQLFIIITYFMMLMATDNVSIYILFLVPMYSICLALMNEKENVQNDYAESPR